MEQKNFITLQQAMKKFDLAQSGGHAKLLIQAGEVFVNGEIETRRGRKLYGGEIIKYRAQEVVVDHAH